MFFKKKAPQDSAPLDRHGNTPLHLAVGKYDPDAVRALLAEGAKPRARNTYGHTPLEHGMALAENYIIEELAEIAEILLAAGTPITKGMKTSLTKLGTSFEFAREAFDKESLPDTEAALTKLYTLLGVPPVPRRSMHDGITPITAEPGPWKQQFLELEDKLVPAQGSAQTVQGEVIRIAGRIYDETYHNGGMNWDDDYRAMADFYLSTLSSGTPLPPAELDEAASMIDVLRMAGDLIKDDGSCIDDVQRLWALATDWVLANPEPITLETPTYNR
ncbi:MAG: hypothetical protein FWG15_06785 [Propionibacteriaceae bacterium]|jgi:hypothetical protein|nr:hypothetical protein [Propionibacteriaceae bacterium]